MSANLVPGETVAMRLAEYAELPLNWDSYGGGPLTDTALIYAMLFADELDGLFVTVQCLVPFASGAVSFEWHCLGHDIEIYIDAHGRFEWAHVWRARSERFPLGPSRDVYEERENVSLYDAAWFVAYTLASAKGGQSR